MTTEPLRTQRSPQTCLSKLERSSMIIKHLTVFFDLPHAQKKLFLFVNFVTIDPTVYGQVWEYILQNDTAVLEWFLQYKTASSNSSNSPPSSVSVRGLLRANYPTQKTNDYLKFYNINNNRRYRCRIALLRRLCRVSMISAIWYCVPVWLKYFNVFNWCHRSTSLKYYLTNNIWFPKQQKQQKMHTGEGSLCFIDNAGIDWSLQDDMVSTSGWGTQHSSDCATVHFPSNIVSQKKIL